MNPLMLRSQCTKKKIFLAGAVVPVVKKKKEQRNSFAAIETG